MNDEPVVPANLDAAREAHEEGLLERIGVLMEALERTRAYAQGEGLLHIVEIARAALTDKGERDG